MSLKKHTYGIVAGLLLLTGAGAIYTKAAQANTERHPEMRAALYHLQWARTELQKSNHDFNGKRVEALNDTNKAIAEVEAALRSDSH